MPTGRHRACDTGRLGRASRRRSIPRRRTCGPASEGRSDGSFRTRPTRPWARVGYAVSACSLMVSFSGAALAQSSAPEADTRAAQIVAAQQQKAHELKVYSRTRPRCGSRSWRSSSSPAALHWHPFFDNAYSGGGFTLGAGYARTSAATTPSTSAAAHSSGYKRIESRVPGAAPVRSPRRAVGPRRMARGHPGRLLRLRHGNTSMDDRANYSFRQPYVSATLDVRPTRNSLVSAAASSTRSGISVRARAPRRRSRRSTRPRRCRAWAPSHVPARAGHARPSTRARRRATRAGAATTA